MATVNLMIIPGVQRVDNKHGSMLQPYVYDQDDNVLWRADYLLDDHTNNWYVAWSDAREAVDCICYERRHQLRLL